MLDSVKLSKTAILLAVLLLAFSAIFAQEKNKNPQPTGKAVLWEAVNVSQQDLFLGPGGAAMRPNLRKVTFVKEETGGTSKKYRIKDANGRIWIAKIGKEAQPETVAVRLLSAIGYKTEINYLAPKLTIPGKGTFKNVRLEARPENIERLDRWKWDDNSFVGTNEFQGLKIMMALLNNWDLKDGNNLIVQSGDEHHYIISDLGATFGKLGSNNLPIFWRVGRSINQPKDYSETDFIKEVESGTIDFSFKGKGSKMFDDISIEHGRWLADLLIQLSDKQIEDAFRAANYTSNEVKTLAQAVRYRIKALDTATKQTRAGW